MPEGLRKVINVRHAKYKQFKDSVSKISFYSLDTLNKVSIDKLVLDVGRQFVGCLINFGDICFHLTSIDVFIHNNLEVDDCAYGLETVNYYNIPTAIVKEKGSMGHSFYEVKIFWGFFELLAVGGYHTLNNNKFNPFLGSALKKWNYGSLVGGEIFVLQNSLEEKDIVRTERLLNQYNKQDACRPFGLHCLRRVLAEFYPISPLHFLTHTSQRYKNASLHHFGSKVLLLFACKQTINTETIENLFVFFSHTKEYLDVCRRSQEFSIDFASFKLTHMNQMGQYAKLLIDLACFAEENVQRLYSCKLCLLMPRVELSEKLLSIMKAGLKKTIDHQNSQIVKSEREKTC